MALDEGMREVGSAHTLAHFFQKKLAPWHSGSSQAEFSGDLGNQGGKLRESDVVPSLSPIVADGSIWSCIPSSNPVVLMPSEWQTHAKGRACPKF